VHDAAADAAVSTPLPQKLQRDDGSDEEKKLLPQLQPTTTKNLPYMLYSYDEYLGLFGCVTCQFR
jgi:hypothetical protein